ncbi:MAG: tandem-95 repeat protein, partial [Proteobacteria bacterium]|nr:tandem-95 repeat protein [Pseudomonadota bacterium]
GAKDIATVTVNVAAAPNSVDAVNDTANTAFQTPVFINLTSNDFDPQGDSFRVTSIGQAANGKISLPIHWQPGDPYEIYYTPNAGFSGTDTFTYEITDSKGAKDTATVTINVGAAPNSVDAVNDTANVTAGQSVNINVRGNDFDPQGDSFVVSRIVSGPSVGSAILNSNGTVTYNSVGRDAYTTTFTYEIRDSKGATDIATVTVNVAAAPNNVVAQNDSTTTSFQTPVTINVLANDFDPQGDTFTVIGATQGRNGGVVNYQGNGIFHYAPPAGGLEDFGFVGTDTFTYTIMDSRGATSTATVSINVLPPMFHGGDGGGVRGEGANDTGPADCPLVIDLDQNGINLIAKPDSQATFDWTLGGEHEHTAWFAPTEAILARDVNNNGTIDGFAEVFGNQTEANGFLELAKLDTNHDGIIDAADTTWNQLKLWFDTNGNGIGETTELHTLENLGVKAIHLGTEATSIRYEDAYIPIQSYVEMQDGTTRVIADVFFSNEGTRTIHGTTGNDVMVFSTTAETIDGGQGIDTLKVLTSSNITVGDDVMIKGVEGIDLANHHADTLTLRAEDVLTMADQGVLTIRGDAVDNVHLTGDVTQGVNVNLGGTDFATFATANGAHILVELGVNVQTDNQHHG